MDEAEIIFLGDFRWDPKTIADFLQAIKDDTIHMQTPSNIYKRDIELARDIRYHSL